MRIGLSHYFCVITCGAIFLSSTAMAAPIGRNTPPGTVFKDCDVCPAMVVVPAGRFVMGAPAQKNSWDDPATAGSQPEHEVVIANPFAVGQAEVSIEEFRQFLKDEGLEDKMPYLKSAPGQIPMEGLSWFDAQGFVEWLSRKSGKQYRLLSEAEWEYAARAGTTGPYPFDYNRIVDKHANWGDTKDGFNGPAPVKSFQPNAFGLFDMIGNVDEWIQDCGSASYEGAPADGSAWETPDCKYRSRRGGGWTVRQGSVGSATRGTSNPEDRYGGLRVARSLTNGADLSNAARKGGSKMKGRGALDGRSTKNGSGEQAGGKAQGLDGKITLTVGSSSEESKKAQQENERMQAQAREKAARQSADKARLNAEASAKKQKDAAEAASARAKYDAELEAHYARCAAKGIPKERCGALGSKR